MTLEVRKISQKAWVRVVDGIPQCSCCQQPMVERGEGWVCAIGAAVLDGLADAVARLDELTEESAERARTQETQP